MTERFFTVDVSDFLNIDMNPSIIEIEEDATKRKREITLAVWTNIVSGPYPVDTGRSRGAWIVTVSKPSVIVPPETVGPNSTPFPPPPRNIDGIKLNRHSWIVNNVHYTPLINEFGTAKAPAKFVERAIYATLQAYR